NNLILPGYPEASPFIEERLSMDTPMGRAWAAVAPKSRGRSWREITVAWVKDHCLLPGETIDQLHTALAAIAVRDAGGAAVATALRPPELAHSVRRIVKPYGNHAVH
ncbi:MAG: hypothetical protein JWM87_3706, partial [Candidatus Eremiobacteraeota bacterium]|nr:hypothetical protein [Candidatus Eremiobacteraeota bacterium]